MRMDPTRGRTAADLLRTLPEEELRRILRTYGEEKRSAAVARALVAAREREPISTTGALARVVEGALGPAARRYRIHPATRTFQALRIVVNDEVEYVERLIAEAVALLRRGGRLVVIAYHSLEDRAVKHGLRTLADRCTCPPRLPVCGCGREDLIRVLTSRPLRPSADEIDRNPRARSAKLRAAERL
jgi:16S rRNA (cytosine1402-N4)-methyltransferase